MQKLVRVCDVCKQMGIKVRRLEWKFLAIEIKSNCKFCKDKKV